MKNEEDRFRNLSHEEMEKLDPMKYLQLKAMEVIRRVENIAKDGSPEDTVKLKANQVLLNKILPDMNRLDMEIKSIAPMEALKKAMEEMDKQTNDGK